MMVRSLVDGVCGACLLAATALAFCGEAQSQPLPANCEATFCSFVGDPVCNGLGGCQTGEICRCGDGDTLCECVGG